MKIELLETRKFVGCVEWLGLAKERFGVINTPPEVTLIKGAGIEGEHHAADPAREKRRVTLFQHEHIDVIARLLGQANIDPAAFRRNIVVSGINIASLIGRRFMVGGAVLFGTSDCPPCARMEKTVGKGAYSAMTSHGGITAIVESGSIVRLGDQVQALPGA